MKRRRPDGLLFLFRGNNMLRKMRRERQQLDEDECIKILKRNTHGTLALLTPEGYPYALPISYAFDESEGKLIFHSAKEGHKIDSIRNLDRGSFAVVDQDEVIPEKLTTAYRSVIIFGHIEFVCDEKKKDELLEKLSFRYAPNLPLTIVKDEIERTRKTVSVITLSIDHISGKKGKELMRQSDLPALSDGEI